MCVCECWRCVWAVVRGRGEATKRPGPHEAQEGARKASMVSMYPHRIGGALRGRLEAADGVRGPGGAVGVWLIGGSAEIGGGCDCCLPCPEPSTSELRGAGREGIAWCGTGEVLSLFGLRGVSREIQRCRGTFDWARTGVGALDPQLVDLTVRESAPSLNLLRCHT